MFLSMTTNLAPEKLWNFNVLFPDHLAEKSQIDSLLVCYMDLIFWIKTDISGGVLVPTQRRKIRECFLPLGVRPLNRTFFPACSFGEGMSDSFYKNNTEQQISISEQMDKQRKASKLITDSHDTLFCHQ